MALALHAPLAAADVSRPGGAGHALLFRDHGVVIENIKDLGEAAKALGCALHSLKGQEGCLLCRGAGVWRSSWETSRQPLPPAPAAIHSRAPPLPTHCSPGRPDV